MKTLGRAPPPAGRAIRCKSSFRRVSLSFIPGFPLLSLTRGPR